MLSIIENPQNSANQVEQKENKVSPLKEKNVEKHNKIIHINTDYSWVYLIIKKYLIATKFQKRKTTNAINVNLHQISGIMCSPTSELFMTVKFI